MVFNGILKLMPTFKGISNKYQFQIITNFKPRTGHLTFEIRNWKFRNGFTLIELLVVIVLFGISASLITASYVTFEKNQKLKNAAQTLKSDLRFAQNKAYSGDKGAGGECLGELAGWYVKVTISASSYSISGNCLVTSGNEKIETVFNTTTVAFPQNVTVFEITYGQSTYASPIDDGFNVNVFFRPLAGSVSFHSAGPTPDFLNDATGNLQYQLREPPVAQDVLTIKLKDQQTAKTFKVNITSSGEISDVK